MTKKYEELTDKEKEVYNIILEDAANAAIAASTYAAVAAYNAIKLVVADTAPHVNIKAATNAAICKIREMLKSWKAEREPGENGITDAITEEPESVKKKELSMKLQDLLTILCFTILISIVMIYVIHECNLVRKEHKRYIDDFNERMKKWWK